MKRHEIVNLSTENVLTLAATIYEHLMTLSKTVFQHDNRYRVGLAGNIPLPNGHPLLAKGYDFGNTLASLGIDLVITTTEVNSLPGQAALGFNERCRGDKKAGNIIVVVPSPQGADARWLGDHENVRYYPQKFGFDFFSGFLSDLVAFVPTRESNSEIMELWQRAQLTLKIALQHGLDKVPPGLRLRCPAVLKGWSPEAICVGDDSAWGWLKRQRDTYYAEGTINTERQEGKFLRFEDDADDALEVILNRAVEWAERFPETPPLEPAARIGLPSLLRQIVAAQNDYSSFMKALAPKKAGFHRTTLFGSHHLSQDDPALCEAYQIGLFLGQQNFDLLEGNGGLDSIMGQVAAGHHQGKSCSEHPARSTGISLQLPWELAGVSADFRDRIVRHSALEPRVHTFLLLLTASIAGKGGVGTGLEEAMLLHSSIDYRRCKAKGQKCTAVTSRSVQLGWLPTQFAFGPESRFAWRRELKDALLSWGDLNPHDEEADVLQFVEDPEELQHRLLANREQWRAFISRKGMRVYN